MRIKETWLKKEEESRAPNVSGYRLRHKPRPEEVRPRGGGVDFYITQGILVQTLIYPETNNVAQMWLNVIIGGKRVIVGTAYRPPWMNPCTFFWAITDSIVGFANYDNIVLMGDFNIDYLDTNSDNIKKLQDFLSYTNLKHFVRKPTHFTDFSESSIDLVCFDLDINNIGSHALLSFEFKRYSQVL